MGYCALSVAPSMGEKNLPPAGPETLPLGAFPHYVGRGRPRNAQEAGRGAPPRTVCACAVVAVPWAGRCPSVVQAECSGSGPVSLSPAGEARSAVTHLPLLPEPGASGS